MKLKIKYEDGFWKADSAKYIPRGGAQIYVAFGCVFPGTHWAQQGANMLRILKGC